MTSTLVTPPVEDGGPVPKGLSMAAAAVVGIPLDETTQGQTTAKLAPTEDPLIDVAGTFGTVVGASLARFGRPRHCREFFPYLSTRDVKGRQRNVGDAARASVTVHGASESVYSDEGEVFGVKRSDGYQGGVAVRCFGIQPVTGASRNVLPNDFSVCGY